VSPHKHMTLEELKERLNALSWEEQMEFEMSERSAQGSTDATQEIERGVQELARQVTPSLLDQLEQNDGYVVWSLRLSPHVPGDSPARRAQRFLHHADASVRYWATEMRMSR
jgi:hypothetical protein